MGIYVWGTGCGASELVEKGLELGRITAFVDSYPCGDFFLGKRVLLPDKLDPSDCDLLIITTRHASAVEKTCIKLGLPQEKLLYLKHHYDLHDKNQNCTAKTLLGDALLKQLLPPQRIIPTPSQLLNAKLDEGDLGSDYVRLATLELLCRRLHNVPGAAAELGVYKGFFARCINQLLPERTLYLFDSFEGFSADAPASEAFQAAHRNTAAEKVLSILPYPDKAILKPGFFPHSLDGLEERFCLVSLDVDFARTTLDGLRYFYPRLNQGGYLLLHDWGNPSLPGVAQALEIYEKEIAAKLPAVPLCDVAGTLILCKQQN